MFEKIRRWLRFNAIYIGRPPWDTGVSPPELVTFLQSAEPGRALDLGSGPGTNLVTMARHGWAVVGVDFALLSVIQARLKLHRADCDGRVIWGDVTGDPDVGAPFDLVLDMGCYHGLSQPGRKAYRQNLRQWLRPGGTYLLYAHRQTPDSTHGIREADLTALDTFLTLKWREDSGEVRPDGGGRPATWARFDRL
jgi:SAM-dependent methyltransferase